MIIYPAVDILKGRCTQLIGGRLGTERFEKDALSSALKFQREGAEFIHLIDLDAAKGIGDNLSLIKGIINQLSVKVQVGGGIRSQERAEELINAGVDRVIIGTKAFKDDEFLPRLCKSIGRERIVLALDAMNKKIAIKGWDEVTNLNPIIEAKRLEDYCGYFLLTCIEKEGEMKGTDFSYFKEFTQSVNNPVIASGGIGSLNDIIKLKNTGVEGVVIGTALYLNKFGLKQAIETAL